ncbi:MAG: M20/M25/M40 family metallo-hydrolase [Bacilli bacterium]
METATGIDRERLIADFMTLVSIGSHSHDEANMAAYIRGVAEELGYLAEEDGAAEIVGGNSGNLIIRVPGNAARSTVLLMAHMDTVVPGHGVQPIRHADRITSDGKTVLGADDKAGVAGLLHMLRVLSATGEDHPPLEIVFTVCEEVGLQGAKALDRKLLQSAYGFVFDSSGPLGFVVTEGPALAKMEARVHGRAAHAGVAPEKGVSAIVVAAEAISAMRMGRVNERTTANIGQIKGGFTTNIVCDLVEIFAEARSLDTEQLQSQCGHMTEVLQQTAERHGVTAEVEWQDSYPAFSLPADSSLRLVVKQAMSELGITPVFAPTGGGSDANVVSGKGIPVLNIAVGYQQIHTLEEWISLDDLCLAAELMLRIVRISGEIDVRV